MTDTTQTTDHAAAIRRITGVAQPPSAADLGASNLWTLSTESIDALTARERRIAAAIERESREAAEAIRRERAAAHRRLWVCLDTLKEQQG